MPQNSLEPVQPQALRHGEEEEPLTNQRTNRNQAEIQLPFTEEVLSSQRKVCPRLPVGEGGPITSRVFEKKTAEPGAPSPPSHPCTRPLTPVPYIQGPPIAPSDQIAGILWVEGPSQAPELCLPSSFLACTHDGPATDRLLPWRGSHHPQAGGWESPGQGQTWSHLPAPLPQVPCARSERWGLPAPGRAIGARRVQSSSQWGLGEGAGPGCGQCLGPCFSDGREPPDPGTQLPAATPRAEAHSHHALEANPALKFAFSHAGLGVNGGHGDEESRRRTKKQPGTRTDGRMRAGRGRLSEAPGGTSVSVRRHHFVPGEKKRVF